MYESIVFCSACTMSFVRTFTFAISSADEFLVCINVQGFRPIETYFDCLDRPASITVENGVYLRPGVLIESFTVRVCSSFAMNSSARFFSTSSI